MRITKIIKAKMGIEDDGKLTVRIKFDDGIRVWGKVFNLCHPMDAHWYNKLREETKSQLAQEMEGKTIKTEYCNGDVVKYYLYHPMYYGHRLQKI